MNKKTILIAVAAGILSSAALYAGDDGTSRRLARYNRTELREALRLKDMGMTARSSAVLDELSLLSGGGEAEGLSVLNDIVMDVPGYEARMHAFIAEESHSPLALQLEYHHALNLFDHGIYGKALTYFDVIDADELMKRQRDEYVFKRAYCSLETGDLKNAEALFTECARRPLSDYTAPARYALGYIRYGQGDFKKAQEWLELASLDGRFRDVAEYYILECRFMQKDHGYVVEKGDAMYESVPSDRKEHLARIIAESHLVLGDVDKALKYHDLGSGAGKDKKTRSDWFFSGSILYAVDDYAGAVESYSNMTDRTDSLGQIANYHLGFSYIQTHNKVAALEAFKEAAAAGFDKVITEDAYFNWAKLAFDINTDTSVFNEYIRRYPAKEQEDKINSYIAVAALHDRDYEGAVNAYDKIDELDDDMVANYMKANYLRADQLVRNGSYRLAIPCLKAAAYYSERGSRFNQLTRFWLAESYYRNDQYQEALNVYTDLYNTSALFGQAESYLIPYNIAYCHFKKDDYEAAMKWFAGYLSESQVTYRKDALLRTADCHFMLKDYKAACQAYDVVLADYFNADDIYPYYQAALSYGLDKNMDKKIELLSNVRTASATAKFYPEALFELGRAYVSKYEDDKAFECFRTLADTVKDSTFVARAYIEMGSLSRNQSQYKDALAYYRTVVEEMPLSGYSEDALAAIEAIYQIKNEPEEYIAYIESIGKGGSKTDSEKEDMIFNSAEQIFLSENYQKALISLQSYLEKYPEGRNAYKADFYIAESYRHTGKYDQACDSYRSVIEHGEGSFVELSMLNFSELSYKLEKWEDAYGGYSSLYSAALIENNKYTALLGMMRSAYRWHNWNEAVKSAEKVIFDSRSDAGVKSEAQYVKAKSYLAMSRRDDALAILSKLAEDLSNPYGAEAAYMLIQDSYDKGDFEEVENKVYAFSDAGTSQIYWLAKSFVTLGDSFVERGDLEQAKATFESVRDGYEPQSADDDVQAGVALRLEKLSEIMSK